MKIIIILLLLVLPVSTHAKECTNKEITDLKRVASNINYSYEYYLNNNEMFFDITITNIYNNIYVIDTENNKSYSNSEVKISKKESGQTLKFNVYSKTCNELLSSKTILLPAYNKFYERIECEDISEFKYCSKWGNYKITDKEFLTKVDEYKQQHFASVDEDVIVYKTEIAGFYVFVGLSLFILLIILIFIIRGKKAKDII